MSPFTTPLILKFLDTATSDKRFELVESFTYHVGHRYSRDVVIVPSGYRTDFASVPRLFWPLLPPVGLYGKAAVIHDYLCDNPTLKTRKEADEIFLEAMIVLGVSRWQRALMFWAVRLWGIISERKPRRPLKAA